MYIWGVLLIWCPWSGYQSLSRNCPQDASGSDSCLWQCQGGFNAGEWWPGTRQRQGLGGNKGACEGETQQLLLMGAQVIITMLLAGICWARAACWGLSCWFSGKESTCQCRRCRFDPWVGKVPWRRKWQPTPLFLPGKSHGHRSLAGYSPRGCKESDTTEHTCTHRSRKISRLKYRVWG